MIAEQYINQGHPQKLVLEVLGIPRSTYADRIKHKIGNGNRGRKPSSHTKTRCGALISNEIVVEQIQDLLSQEFVDYGYLKVTHWLRQNKGYIINPKKVRRLMKEKGLLNTKKVYHRAKRTWVKDMIPNTKQPFDYLEFDIKYEYVQRAKRNALTLTVLDVNTRWVLGHLTAWSIRQVHIKKLFDQIFKSYSLPKSIYVRCDNGSQFVSEMIQKYFERHQVIQEFCKPATPEQNGHIEAYHSIVEKVVCQAFEFDSLEELQQTKNRFVRFYNWERIHSGIKYLSPYKYLLSNSIDMNQSDLTDVLDCSIFEEQIASED